MSATSVARISTSNILLRQGEDSFVFDCNWSTSSDSPSTRSISTTMPVKTKEMLYQTFHPFPELPTELRWKVYEYSLPGNRVIRVKSSELPSFI